MGNCCSRNLQEKEVKDILEQYQVMRAMVINYKGLDYICVFNFQDKHAQIILPELEPQITQFSVMCKAPLVYIAGGIEKSGDATKRLWMASVSNGKLKFTELKSMNLGRRKPFLLGLKVNVIFAIGGYGSESKESAIRVCEKYTENTDSWSFIASLTNDPNNVFSIGTYIYSFGSLENGDSYERYNTESNEYKWQILNIKTFIPGVGSLKNYGIACPNQVEGELYIFGGVIRDETKSRDIYKLKAENGSLTKENRQLPEEAEIAECYTEGNSLSYFINTNYRLCIYNKVSRNFYFQDTGISKAIDEEYHNLVS